MTQHDLSWSTVDVSIPGSGPNLTLGRTYKAFKFRDVNQGSVFADQFFALSWELDVPRITYGRVQSPAQLLRGCDGFSGGVKGLPD